jgi:hypothetical protein
MLHKRSLCWLLLPAAVLVGCSDDSAKADGQDAGVGGSSGADAAPDATPDSNPEAGIADACLNVEALRPTCLALPDSFATSTTIAKGCYVASKSPSLAAGVTLTISPGVTIFFAATTHLLVDGDRVLVAAGTEKEPICLTGDKSERGFWNGLVFDHNEAASTLDHVTVAYAGSTKSDAKAAAIKATTDSSGLMLNITNTTVRDSQGYGLFLDGSSVVTAFSHNAFTKNTLGPANVHSEVVDVLDAASTYTGNDIDEITVRASKVSHDCSWKAIGVPFHLDGGLQVTKVLTLEAPNTILMAADQTFAVDGDEGALAAVGTAAKPILFTAEQKQRGFWGGLVFGSSNNAKNALDYVTVEYAGATKSDSTNGAVKAIADSHGVTLSMSNTTVRESQGYGLYLGGSAEMPVFAANTFTSNTLGPASVDSRVAGLLDTASKYTGNDVDEITVRSQWLDLNPVWHFLGVPYHFTSHLTVNVPWTVEAPNTLIMPQDGWISVDGDGAALTAAGTADKPILFTAETKQRGFWSGVVFNGGNNTANKLDYVTVEYAGSTKSDSKNAAVKAIADSHGVTLSMTHTTLHESQGYGFFLTGSGVLPAFANNILTKNTLGPVSIGSAAAHQLDVTTDYTGNDVDHVLVRDSYVSQTVTWLDLGVPYELESYMHVTLVWTLAPGVTLLMPKDGWISVDGDDSGFHVVGTAQKPITITGVEKTVGYWHTIAFGNTLNGANAFEYATVENGGSANGAGEKGMINMTSDSHGVAATIKNCTIRNSAQYGIYLGHYGQSNSDVATINTFSGNVLGDVFHEP